MSHERIFRCQSATFHIDGATYQIVTNEEPTNGVKILRKKDSPTVDLTVDMGALTHSSVLGRLKLILEKIEAGTLSQITNEVLAKNIQYAIQLIQDGSSADREQSEVETTQTVENSEHEEPIEPEHESELLDKVPDIQIEDRRVAPEQDNELSEVDEDGIPEEVRQWLAATFTKNLPAKPRSEPRPRFRSVANAIRVGLFVDRFYRQLSNNTLQIPAEIVQHLKEINNWHFDIFKLQDMSTCHSLKYVAKELFSRYGIVQRYRMNLDKLDAFLAAVEHGYTKLKNPYHNDVHAADVTQTLHYFIGASGVANILTDLEIFAMLFAALIHDFEHTGRTNNFHINTSTDLALMYNDRSVLENHHVSAAFRLLKEEDKNILSNLKPEEYREFRTLVIEMVLSTDMSTHFAQIKHVRAVLNGDKTLPNTNTTTMTLMSLMLHGADIGHPGKPWRVHKRLADLILEEFFLQGDEEARLGLPFSPLCDRNNVLVPESQISFIEFIVEPTLSIMSDLIDLVVKADEGPLALPGSPGKPKTPSNSVGATAPTRRTESENCIKSEGGKAVLNSRTPSFPLQGSQHSAYGPNQRPWINHLAENKAKWRMISAEHASAKEKELQEAQQQTTSDVEDDVTPKPAPPITSSS